MSIDEATRYQTKYGGKIHKLSHVECEDDEEEGEIKASYYMSNLKEKAELKNGYRYVKELLLQHHSLK